MAPETRAGRGHNLVGAMLERRYRVDSLIARGGMSTVYRGLDTRLERPVALKVMDAQYSGDRSFVERFEREARAAARLHHPDIVAVYDQGVDRDGGEDLVYLVMQLIEGCTLRDIILADGALPVPLALTIMRPVLSALGAAHGAGMVHRDVKPENVLIGRDGSIKVADFGLVRAAAAAGTTSGSVILGTVAYLSPEQVTTGAADARSDVYAAGILLYEMLTGTPPYRGDTALSIAYRHVNDDVPAPSERVPELPPALDDLILRATRRDAQVRPADASALLSELEQVRTGLGIDPVPVSVPASEAGTERLEGDVAEPPTEHAIPVAAASSGPQGTRALARPSMDDDEATAELPAVRHEPYRPQRRGGRAFALWTALVLVLAALVGGAAWWLGAGRYVEVPRVVGKREAVAQQVLHGAGLTPQITRDYSDTVPDGTVISSSPAGGSRVLTGRKIDLVVSLGLPKVPTITQGMTAQDAERVIREAKLRPVHDVSLDQYNASIPQGRVIGVDPGSGSRLAISSPVTIVLSKGPQPVAVPDVRGAAHDQAFAILRDAGFDPYDAGSQYSADVDGGHVISTDPSPGSQVLLTGRPRIGVVVSNAVTVPDFNGQPLASAQQQAAAAGLTLDVRQLFNRPNAVVLGQFPLPGTRVQAGSTVHASAF